MQFCQALEKLVPLEVSINGKALKPVQPDQAKAKSVTDDVVIVGNVPVKPVQPSQALYMLVTFEVLVGGLKIVILLFSQVAMRFVSAALVVI